MAIVFQYGSNCLESEINSNKRLRRDATFVGLAETVKDYELAFQVPSTNRGCAAATIIETPGKKVWGVLYEIPDYLIKRETAKARRRKALDVIEGEGTNYDRASIDVRKPDGTVVTALTYLAKDPQSGLRTSWEYAGYIIAGLRQRRINDVNREYIAEIKAIVAANNPDIAAEIEAL